ncbi:RNA-guided endonuclease InsQ/TnpB family protein [Deinococcus murrayi]|uniref:RNA-guided endonuclease InsQ/TnpB family protein n=1 Tax=Deinococcus murrayi TaxID=68910 RepID=UPI00048481FD|nr:zinc ribbon domain-containing protein [Deinococcus murrayi]
MSETTIVRVFRYRLYPTKPQEAAMFETLRLTRTLYNAGLEQRREAYRKHGKTLSAYDQQKELTALKEACPEFSGVYSHVLQDVFDRLDKAYKAFFSQVKKGAKRAGFLFQLSSKAESAGRRVIAVDPRDTSQRCHACGHTGKENRVNQATFRCVQCGHTANADHNAAKNILGRAVPSALNGSGVSHAVV